jgi:hypothetical protein
MIYTKHERRRRTHKTNFVLSPDEVRLFENLQHSFGGGEEVSKAVVLRHALRLLRVAINKGYRPELPA